MPEWMLAVLKEAPVAGALLAVVWMFLKQQRLLSQQWGDASERSAKAHVSEGKLNRTAIEANTMVLGQVGEALRRFDSKSSLD